MKTTKVKDITTYKDSQGEHIVCVGKLELIFNFDYFPEVDQLGFNKIEEKLYLNKVPPSQHLRATDNLCVVLPVITSEDEPKPGDLVFHKLDGKVISVEDDMDGDIRRFGYKKVLATLENLTPKHLQAIVDNKIKDGDKLYVECYHRGKNSEGNDADLTGGLLVHKDDYYCTRLKEGKLTIFRYDSWYSEDEFKSELKRLNYSEEVQKELSPIFLEHCKRAYERGKFDSNEWFKANELLPPVTTKNLNYSCNVIFVTKNGHEYTGWFRYDFNEFISNKHHNFHPTQIEKWRLIKK